MKKIIPLVLSLLLLSGCWDLRESEKLGIVTFLGIDSAGNGALRVVIQELSSEKNSLGTQAAGGASTVEVHEAMGRTVTEAVSQINNHSPHVTDFSHTYAIVLSEELVSAEGISPLLDFLERTPSIRHNVWLLISRKGQFSEVCDPEAAYNSSVGTGKVIMEIIHNNQFDSVCAASTLGDFLNMYWEKGAQPYTAGVGLAENKPDKPDSFDIAVEDTAVFRDGKLAGWLGEEETMGLLWVKGGLKDGIFSVEVGGKELSLDIVKESSKIKPERDGNAMRAAIAIRAKVNLMESQTELDFTDAEALASLKEAMREKIAKQVNSAFERSKVLDSDVFGLGNYFYGKYPAFWRDIEDKGTDYCQLMDISLNIVTSQGNIGLMK